MWGILAALALVVINGFFVAAEFAFVRVRPARLERLAKKGSVRAQAALRILADLERYLSVSQIGITLASLALGWIGEPAIAHVILRGVFLLTGRDLGTTAHGIAVGVSFALITYFHVLLGEQVPKMIALRRAEDTALALAAPFRAMFVVLLPILFLVDGATRVILGLFGLSGSLHGEGKLSEEELTAVIAATLARGKGAEDKRQLLERVVRFASRQARHAMVPRVDVASLPLASTAEEALAYLRAQEFSRVVLTEKSDLDRVVGYLYAKDLLLDPSAANLPNLTKLRRDVLFVPEAQSLIEVLRTMQQSSTLFAIVVDEYGGTSGIVTMEDLVEEIVGEIRDEADEEDVPKVREVEGLAGAYDVEGTTALDELRFLGVELADDELPEPIAGYVVRQLGRLPRRGDRVRIGSFDAEVRVVRRRRIERVRLSPHAPTMRPADLAAHAQIHSGEAEEE